jgi:shikimate kinase/3-dehydroquinate synthase
MMKSIVLSGFMATGKSTVGPMLAARIGAPFVDTDEILAREAGRTVAEIFKDEGEAAFREREARVIQRLLDDDTSRVIAFGGGAVTSAATRHRALERALVVTLTAEPETVVARVANIAARPNLAVGDPVARARALLAARAEAYAECHATLATDAADPDAIVDAILALAERDPIVVPLGSRTYDIDVCVDAPTRLTDAVARCAPSSVVLVTDASVQRARGAAIEAALEPLALEGTRVTLPAGERHKNLAAVSTIWDAALGAGIDRDALVVAVGGGVVGDLAGFAASAILRGVRFLQVPTTLLAMVDASVGGKTGFDHAAGKNLVGAFHQPSGVVVDLAHLKTLPARERIAGLAEVAKIALTHDAALFERLERDAAILRAGDADALLPVVRAAIMAKVRVVRDDEREMGVRALLNLGHTIGHAIEAHGAFEKHLHGEAVAIGTVAELRAGAALGLGGREVVDRARDLLARLGLPVDVPSAELMASWPFVLSDKKRVRDAVRLPVVPRVGEAKLERVRLGALRTAVLG